VEKEFARDEARRWGSVDEHTNSPDAESPFRSYLTPGENHSWHGDTTRTEGPDPVDREEPITHSHVSSPIVTQAWTVVANSPGPRILQSETRTKPSTSASRATALEREHQHTSRQDPYPASHFPQASVQMPQRMSVIRLDCRDTSQVPSRVVPSWPLDTPQEAHLLRHFIDNVSCFVSFPHRLPELSGV
jgi:hypothetical protein